MEAIFRVDGGRVEVSPNAAGPWDPRMQHGSAPAGLAVWAAEAIPTPVPMRVARVTVDLMRPVPLAPLTLETEVLREGRKIQLCAVRVRADGVLTVSATVLRVKLTAETMPPDVGGPAVTLPGPDESPEDPAQFSNSPFVMGMQLRAARGTFGVRGPGAIWYRVKRPFVEGAAVSQAMRAVIAADFCNGTSAALDFRDWTFLNADLTVSMTREPVGEWILLDAESWIGPEGAGLAMARLADTNWLFRPLRAESRHREEMRWAQSKPSLPMTGGCSCGAIRYEITSFPLLALHLQLHRTARPRPAAPSRSTCRSRPRAFASRKGEPKGWHHLLAIGRRGLFVVLRRLRRAHLWLAQEPAGLRSTSAPARSTTPNG